MSNSDDCQNWKLLPVPQRAHLALTQLCNRPFQGDPGLMVEIVNDAPLEYPFPDENTPMPEETDVESETLKMDQENEEERVEEENVDEAKMSDIIPDMKESEQVGFYDD